MARGVRGWCEPNWGKSLVPSHWSQGEDRRGSWDTPHPSLSSPVRVRRRRTESMKTWLPTTWMYWGWSSPCVLSCWGIQTSVRLAFLFLSCQVVREYFFLKIWLWESFSPLYYFFFYYLESSGAVGWLSTARVSVSPTPSTTTTPSRSCPASCCPSQQWWCPTYKTQLRWLFPLVDSDHTDHSLAMFYFVFAKVSISNFICIAVL